MFKMMELFTLQIQMFLLIFVGMVLKRKKIVSDSTKNDLTDLLISFILPCNIINSFRVDFDIQILKKFFMLLAISLTIQLFAYLIGKVIFIKEKEDEKKVLQYLTLVSNAGFLGFPIAEGVYGAQGLLYASVFILPNRVMMWTAGVSCFTKKSENDHVFLKVLLHPCIIAVYIGLVLMVTQFKLPDVIDKFLTGAGGCTTTVSMLIIGLILSEIDLRTIVKPKVLYATLIRLGIMPLFALILCRILRVDTLLTGVSVLLTAMPAGSSTAMLAAKYDGDYIFATKCTVFTTIVSILTIPLWLFVI